MAIQVSGTEVISNSRVLSNVTGLKTVNGNALLGSGNIAVGASTTYGAVETYFNGAAANAISPDQTVAASIIEFAGGSYPSQGLPIIGTGYALSGTWRCMGGQSNGGAYYSTVFVRIS